MTLAMLVLLGLFVSLGRWQWHRGEAKQTVWAEFQQNSPPESLGTRKPDSLPRFARIEVEGQFRPDHQFLLDNRSYQGKPGYEVLTPFHIKDVGLILVNRGWVPFSGYRDRLPDISQPGSIDTRFISGQLEDLPAAGLASGRAAPEAGASWPKLTSFPTHEELQASLGEKISTRILLLDPKESGGYVRDWHPPGMDPSRHFSYAIQWWGFAAVLLVLYFGLNFRKVS